MMLVKIFNSGGMVNNTLYPLCTPLKNIHNEFPKFCSTISNPGIDFAKYVFWKSFAYIHIFLFYNTGIDRRNRTKTRRKMWRTEKLVFMKEKRSSNLRNEAEKALLCLVIGAVRYPNKIKVFLGWKNITQ